MSKELDQKIADAKTALLKLELESSIINATEKTNRLQAQVTALTQLLETISPLLGAAKQELEALVKEKDSLEKPEREYW